MKKVFVLICEGVYDYEGGIDFELYQNYEDAKKAFQYNREEIIEEWVDNGSWVVEVDKENYFLVNENGDYTRNRYEMKIKEQEIH